MSLPQGLSTLPSSRGPLLRSALEPGEPGVQLGLRGTVLAVAASATALTSVFLVASVVGLSPGPPLPGEHSHWVGSRCAAISPAPGPSDSSLHTSSRQLWHLCLVCCKLFLCQPTKNPASKLLESLPGSQILSPGRCSGVGKCSLCHAPSSASLRPAPPQDPPIRSVSAF